MYVRDNGLGQVDNGGVGNQLYFVYIFEKIFNEYFVEYEIK